MRTLAVVALVFLAGCVPKLWVNPAVTDIHVAQIQIYDCQRDALSIQFADPMIGLLFRGMYFERCMRVHGYEKQPAY